MIDFHVTHWNSGRTMAVPLGNTIYGVRRLARKRPEGWGRNIPSPFAPVVCIFNKKRFLFSCSLPREKRVYLSGPTPFRSFLRVALIHPCLYRGDPFWRKPVVSVCRFDVNCLPVLPPYFSTTATNSCPVPKRFYFWARRIFSLIYRCEPFFLIVSFDLKSSCVSLVSYAIFFLSWPRFFVLFSAEFHQYVYLRYNGILRLPLSCYSSESLFARVEE